MGVYNCEDTLDEALQSIINQTYENWELIICDDCSKDSTFEIAKKYSELYSDKIKLIKNDKNLKLANSLNNCLKLVSGDFIARMDGDDISLPKRFETQVEFLNNNLEYDLVGSRVISFDEYGDVGVKPIIEKPDKYCFRLTPPFAHPTIMARKYVYEELGGYRVAKETRRCEDLDLWFRFYKKEFSGYNIQTPLYKLREHKSDFKRRKFSHGLDAAKVCLRGFKLLNYPKKYYIYLLKPVISSLLPSFMRKMIHNARDKKFKYKYQ